MEGKWWGGKNVNIGRMFILIASRNDVVRFEVNITRGRSEFGDGCELLEDRVKAYLRVGHEVWFWYDRCI
jgi:hypothetical protein